jgi:hypothetical protein
MKSNLKHLTAGALVLAALNHVEAQYAPPSPPSPFKGFITEYMNSLPDYTNRWDIGGAFRGRYQANEGYGIAGTAGSVDFRDHGVRDNNEYFLARIRFHAAYAGDWWGVYIEPQSSIAKSDLRAAYADSPAVPGTVKYVGNGPEDDNFDLHQGYVTLGNAQKFPLTLKAGRQELSYGDQRLIGPSDWNNIGRSFDAAKLSWQGAGFVVDAFSGWPVVPQDYQFDDSNTHDTFSGVYATFNKIPKTILETYFLAENADRHAVNEFASPQTPQPSARDVYTVGGRLKSKPGELLGFDYAIEGAYQFGDFADPTKPALTAPRLREDAYMFTALAGWTFTNLWSSPRIGAEFDYGSGDNNSADGVQGTFNTLFPTNHKFYGSMDLFSLQNLQDLGVNLSLKPTKRTSVAIMANAFWLASTGDYLYNVSGTPRTTGGYGIHPNYNNFVGTEISTVAGYALTRFALLEAGYGHFFAGDYIDQSQNVNGGARDANWVYVQTTIKF